MRKEDKVFSAILIIVILFALVVLVKAQDTTYIHDGDNLLMVVSKEHVNDPILVIDTSGYLMVHLAMDTTVDTTVFVERKPISILPSICRSYHPDGSVKRVDTIGIWPTACKKECRK